MATDPRDCGVIAVRLLGGGGDTLAGKRVELAAVHCSASMAFAHLASGMQRPKCFIDRQDVGHHPSTASYGTFMMF